MRDVANNSQGDDQYQSACPNDCPRTAEAPLPDLFLLFDRDTGPDRVLLKEQLAGSIAGGNSSLRERAQALWGNDPDRRNKLISAAGQGNDIAVVPGFSPSARRSAEMLCARLFSSTKLSGQTFFSNSSRVRILPGFWMK